MHGFGKWF
jgi:hypothetical protein